MTTAVWRFPSAGTPGPKSCTDAVLLRAQTVGTTSYVDTDDVNTMGVAFVMLGIRYTKGDETQYDVRVLGWNGLDWVPLGYAGAPSNGYSPITPNVPRLTAANYAAGANAGDVGIPPFYCEGYQKVKCQVRYSGGVAPGTIGITASGIVSSARG